MLRAQFNSPKLTGQCPCCGERHTVLFGGVYDDQSPYALIEAIFTRPSGRRPAGLRVTLTGRGPAGPVPRETFTLKLRSDAENYLSSFVDAVDGEDIPADAVALTIFVSSTGEALTHLRRQVFSAIDCAVKEDVFQQCLARFGLPGIQ